MPTRRHFLQWTGVGAAAALTARHACAQPTAAADTPPAKGKPKRAYELGLASYTFLKFPLDPTLAMTKAWA